MGLRTIGLQKIGVQNPVSGKKSSATPVIIPVFVSAIVANATPTKIAVTFDVALDDTSIPNVTAFLTESKIVTEVVISGAVVTLTTLTAFTAGETIVLTYVKPETNPLKSLTGGEALGFSEAITNNIAPVIPELVSAETNNESYEIYNVIRIYFDLSVMDSELSPDNSAFQILINSIPVNAILDGWNNEVGNNYIELTKTDQSAFIYGDIVTVSYTAPEVNPLQGVDGGLVASFVDYPVTNNIEAP
jgi:hypothetical protein